jgi:hypothetical protein
MEKFSNVERQPKRRVSGRIRVRPFQAMTPMGEAVWAKAEGLDQLVAKPLKRESLK